MPSRGARLESKLHLVGSVPRNRLIEAIAMKIDAVSNGFGFRGEDFALPRIHILEQDYEILADIVC
jgi:hypothetical protein